MVNLLSTQVDVCYEHKKWHLVLALRGDYEHHQVQWYSFFFNRQPQRIFIDGFQAVARCLLAGRRWEHLLAAYLLVQHNHLSESMRSAGVIASIQTVPVTWIVVVFSSGWLFDPLHASRLRSFASRLDGGIKQNTFNYEPARPIASHLTLTAESSFGLRFSIGGSSSNILRFCVLLHVIIWPLAPSVLERKRCSRKPSCVGDCAFWNTIAKSRSLHHWCLPANVRTDAFSGGLQACEGNLSHNRMNLRKTTILSSIAGNVLTLQHLNDFLMFLNSAQRVYLFSLSARSWSMFRYAIALCFSVLSWWVYPA